VRTPPERARPAGGQVRLVPHLPGVDAPSEPRGQPRRDGGVVGGAPRRHVRLAAAVRPLGRPAERDEDAQPSLLRECDAALEPIPVAHGELRAARLQAAPADVDAHPAQPGAHETIDDLGARAVRVVVPIAVELHADCRNGLARGGGASQQEGRRHEQRDARDHSDISSASRPSST